MLTAFLSLVCGLVLDTHAKNSRKTFEVQMNIIRIMLKNDDKRKVTMYEH